LHRPILAEKIKPKKPNLMGYNKLFNHEVYLLFSNHNLYTMRRKAYDEGEIDMKKLIRNKIEVEYLSHIIIFP